MTHSFYPAKDTSMKNATAFLIFTIVIILFATLALPWCTQVVSVDNYFYSVSKAGAQTVESLPVVVPLILTLAVMLVNGGSQAGNAKRSVILICGIIITLYAGYYYCGKALAFDETPGFGALFAMIGGMLMVIVYVVISGKR